MRACPSCLSVYATDAEFCGLDGDRLLQAEGDPLAGKIIGRYRLEAQIGLGASGLVYRATALGSGEVLAMKLLFGEMACDRRVVQRFRREAETAAKLRHPNVVSVLDFEVAPSGLTYLVMELLSGTALDQVITDEAPMPAFRAANIARQIAAGLAEAHRQGFIHRDLKPGNVMLVEQDGAELAKILDFGIVGRIRAERNESRLTKTGYVVGTPAYMAPEQIDESVELGPATDLYALGAILYELLTGRSPFSGTVEQILVKKLTRDPEPLVQHGALGRLTLQLLARDPKQRPPSALHVSAEIHRLSNPGNDAKTVLTAAPWASQSDVINAPTLPQGRLPSFVRQALGDTLEAPAIDEAAFSVVTGPAPLIAPTRTDPDLPEVAEAGSANDSGQTTLLDEPAPSELERAPSTLERAGSIADDELVVPVLSRDASFEPYALGSARPTDVFVTEKDRTDPSLPLGLERAAIPSEVDDATPLVEVTFADQLPRGADVAEIAADQLTGQDRTDAGVTAPRKSPFTATQLSNLLDVADGPPALEDTAVRPEPRLAEDEGDRTVGVARRPRARGGPSWTQHKLTYAAVGLLGFGIGLFAVLALLSARQQPETLELPAVPVGSSTIGAGAKVGELRGEKTVVEVRASGARAASGETAEGAGERASESVRTATRAGAPRAEPRATASGGAAAAAKGAEPTKGAPRSAEPATGAAVEQSGAAVEQNGAALEQKASEPTKATRPDKAHAPAKVDRTRRLARPRPTGG